MITCKSTSRKSRGRKPNGLGMSTPAEPHSWVCKRLYDGLSIITREKNKLEISNLDREAPVYRWEKVGEIKPDIAYFSSVEKASLMDVSYTKPIFEIEVVNNHGKKPSFENIKIVLQNVESMQEAFLYNYQTQKWTRYTPSGELEPNKEESDYSSVFKVHLDALLSD